MTHDDPLPQAWMERLFSRLTALYGNRMTTMWGDVPQAEVMDAWRQGLRGIEPDAIALALLSVTDQYPDWPPTLGQFAALCKPPPTPRAHREFPKLGPPKKHGPVPPEVSARINAILAQPRPHPKAWAEEILRLHEQGRYDLYIGIEMAKEALGITTRNRQPGEDDL